MTIWRWFRGPLLALSLAWAGVATALWLQSEAQNRKTASAAYGMSRVVQGYRLTGERCLATIQRVGDGEFRFPMPVYLGPEAWAEVLLAYKDSTERKSQ